MAAEALDRRHNRFMAEVAEATRPSVQLVTQAESPTAKIVTDAPQSTAPERTRGVFAAVKRFLSGLNDDTKIQNRDV